jgi:hypothetical protein
MRRPIAALWYCSTTAGYGRNSRLRQVMPASAKRYFGGEGNAICKMFARTADQFDELAFDAE